MLSDRRQFILRALIEEYVSHAMPVGSLTLTEHYSLGVSPATVRNDLSVLEEAGLIQQPHTSAGRIPTDAGYRAFVDSILTESESSGARPDPIIAERIRTSADALDQIAERATAEMTRLTECLSIVCRPVPSTVPIRHVSLIWLSSREALAVVVMTDGRSQNVNLHFAQDVDLDALRTIEQIVCDAFSGNSVSQIEAACLSGSANDAILCQVVLTIQEAIQSSKATKTSRYGMTALLKQPEFHEATSILPILEILEDDTVVMRLIQEAGHSEDISVSIGSENSVESLSGVSVVAGSYGSGSARGIVAVIGPKRMNYAHVINAVKTAQAALSD